MIIIDADACPGKEDVIKMAREFSVPVMLVASYAHHMPKFANVTIYQTDTAPQAVDIIIMNETRPGDVVITQDYGLAAVVLGKSGKALSPRGMLYTQENIDGLLEIRNLHTRIRRGGGRTKGPSAHTKHDTESLLSALRKLLANNNNN